MKKKNAVISLAVASVLACGTLAGCDLVSTDVHKDYMQVVATVDLAKSEQFQNGGEYALYKDVVQPANILKRDMVASFIGGYYNYVNSYGYSYKQTFDLIASNLVEEKLTIQYAMVYLLKNGADAAGNTYTVAGYNSAVQNVKDETDKQIAGLEYFLTDTEEAKALYATRRLFNNTLDSYEKNAIKSEEESDSSSSSDARTTPKGIDTKNSDYYDPNYNVYTGSNSLVTCGSYEAVEGSTPTTRKSALASFLSSLYDNDLIFKGEKPLDNEKNFNEELYYFKVELLSQYESAITNKLASLYEKQAEEKIGGAAFMQKYYNDMYKTQKDAFNAVGGAATFKSALDGVSDTDFLLTSPKPQTSDEGFYGYVINILLPFSTAQTAEVKALNADYGDPKGNSYAQRARILKKVEAVDQRSSWFTGKTDYSFDAAAQDSPVSDYYKGTVFANRSNYLFFADSLAAGENAPYEQVKNYLGKYTYNGTVYKDSEGKYTLRPNKMDIDEFIQEMEGYLTSIGLTVSGTDYSTNYYDTTYADYYDNEGKIDYSSFLYYKGKVDFGKDFDANSIFVKGTPENNAFSAINELSFAYNTDTAGLNPYYGYSVVTGKTSYVSEFEYAAQLACTMGPGAYTVAPSTYGWHIMYCTFSFMTDSEGEIEPFSYNHTDALNTKGSFSNLLYESVKSSTVSNYSKVQQTLILNAYKSGCSTVYEERYKDLASISTGNSSSSSSNNN